MADSKKIKTSIQIKVAAAILILLMVTVTISIIISVRNQRSNLLDTKLTDIISSNNILKEVIKNIMLSGEAPLAVQTLTDLKALPDFKGINIYRRDGTIAFSDYSTLSEVNSRLGEGMRFKETPRIEVTKISTDEFQEVITTNTPRSVENLESREMIYYFPLLNYSECRQCHGSDHFVRGVTHYNISLDQVFDKIASARNVLILFFLVTGIVIAGILIFVMHRMVIKPIIGIGNVVTSVGSGNLEVQSEYSSADELGNLSQKINTMIAGLKEKRELEIQNEVIDARNQENRKYLDNINEGLLLINKDRAISEQYSSFITELFGREEIAGEDFIDFIYPRTPAFTEKREELAQFIDMIFTKPSTEMEMILSINPLSDVTLEIKGKGNTKKIVVDTAFERIWNDGKIENVMVIFTDKTDIVRVQQELKEEKQRSASELEHIAAIMKSGPQAFIDFEKDSIETLATVENNLDEKPNEKKLAKMKRDLHSLKGSARYLEFRNISSLANSLEDILQKIQEGETRWDEAAVKEMKTKLDSIRVELESIREINEKFKDFAQAVDSETSKRSEFTTFLENLKKMVESIGEEMEKDVEVIIINKLQDFPYTAKIRNPLIHIARNAVDHGIEDEFERVAAGKKEPPKIQFRFTKDDDHYIITITDNGRGIDFDSIFKKAKSLGLIDGNREAYSRKDLLQLLFKSDFTTKENATDISGRGIGLDAVQEEIHSAGGRLSVTTDWGKGSRFTINLPKKGDKK